MNQVSTGGFPYLSGYPITCSCGLTIGTLWEKYLQMKESQGIKFALDSTVGPRKCCRQIMMTAVNVAPVMIGSQGAVDYRPNGAAEDEGDHGMVVEGE